MNAPKHIDSNYFRELYIFTIILLVACPIVGQAYNKLCHSENFITVHQEADKVYFELDEKLLNKDMLFVVHGLGYKNITFKRHKDQILLTEESVSSLSGVRIPLDQDPSKLSSIIAIFPIIKTRAERHTVFFDVTAFFSEPIGLWSSESSSVRLKNSALIENVSYLKNEIVLEIQTLKWNSNNKTRSLRTDYYSFFLLPEPMTPRAFDYRMGYFTEDELSSINHFPENAKGNISRWRLEKEVPNAELSAPKKHITFYLDSTIPNEYRSYVKAGILEWQPAFEAAGFKNVLKVKDLPKDKGNWSYHSVNHSIIRWNEEDYVRGSDKIKGSTVSKIVDFRSGEILKSDLILNISYQGLADDYFIRCSPIDKRAQQYPFPNDLMGELIQYIVAHEAGHAFGLRDGSYGEYAYPFSKMRKKNWLKTMGFTPSIMNYTRQHYLPQPKDSLDSSLFIQKVGPTDFYSIKWGYDTFSSSAEKIGENYYLDTMIKRQDSIPWYQFNLGQFEIIGPQYVNEVADNDDPIESAKLGLQTIQNVFDIIENISTHKNDYVLSQRLYKKSLDLWEDQMLHVTSLIGGYKTQYGPDKNLIKIVSPIDQKTQEKALEFLIKHSFDSTEWLESPNFISRSQFLIASNRLQHHQLKILNSLISPTRLKRLEHMESMEAYETITYKTLETLYKGLWQELTHDSFEIKPYRQELQSVFVQILVNAIEQPNDYKVTNPATKYYDYSDYSKSLFASILFALEKEISANLLHTKDASSKGHLQLCLLKIIQFQTMK